MLLGGVLLVACSTKARLETEAKQTGAGVDVKVNVVPAASGTMTFKGLPAFEKLGPQPVVMGEPLVVTVKVPGIPAGKNTVAMHFEGKGKGLARKVSADGTFTFDRTPATPELHLSGDDTKTAPQKLPCSGRLCWGTGFPFGADRKLYVEMKNCDGCVVEAGAQKIVVKGDSFPVALDAISVIANAPLAGLTGISDVKAPFKVTQGIDTGEIALEGTATTLLTPILRRVAEAGLPLPGEAATPATTPKSAVLVRKDAGLFFRVVGTPAKVRDIDLVGVATVIQKALPSCGVYEGTTSKTKVTVAHNGESYDLTVYDRRTGKTVARRLFPYEDKGCADTLVAKTVTSVPNDEKVVAWTKSLLR